MRKTELFTVKEASQVGEVRRASQALALDHGFNEHHAGRVALITSEIASNLLKHAGGGEILLQHVFVQDEEVIEIAALDRGRGMADVSACMRDGHSTTGTMGGGLGAMARQADELDILSEPGKGTVLVARIWKGAMPRIALSPSVGALCLPYPGEPVCGDACSIRRMPGRTLAMVVDGLGHGLGAADASNEALRVFAETSETQPVALMAALHAALRRTRGAVGAIALIDHDERTLTYCGLGNIVAFIIRDAKVQSLVSHDGTIGYLAPRIHQFHYEWSEANALVMHSDGLSTRTRPDHLDRLLKHTPSLMAAMLLRDCKRARDDITVMVVKGGASS